MTLKEKLMQEVDAFPEALLAQTLDFVLFLKTRHLEPDLTLEEQETILASQTAYEEGDYLTLDQYEANQE